MANQMAMVFSKLDCQPRWRERLSELAIPALVIHGRRDPFCPVGNGEALAHEIPGARLLMLERAATAIPDAVAGEVAAAVIELGPRQLSWRSHVALGEVQHGPCHDRGGPFRQSRQNERRP